MKKTILFALIFSLFGASVAMGASTVKELFWYDHIVQIKVQNGSNAYINRFEDNGNTCYVLTNSYSSDSKASANFGISCVKSK